MGPFYTQKLLRKPLDTQNTSSQNNFAQRTFYTEKLLHANAFIHRYKEKPLHRAVSTRGNCYTEKPLHRTAFTHRFFYAEKPLHRAVFTEDSDAFAHKIFDIDTHRNYFRKTVLHTHMHLNAQMPFYTGKLLHTDAWFTYRRFHKENLLRTFYT